MRIFLMMVSVFCLMFLGCSSTSITADRKIASVDEPVYTPVDDANSPLNENDPEFYKGKVCQVEILAFKGHDYSSGEIPARAEATLDSMCTGVIIGRQSFLTDHHCISGLGYSRKTNSTYMGRIVCHRGQEVHFFSKNSLRVDPSYNEQAEGSGPVSVLNDYAVINVGDFRSAPVDLPKSAYEFRSALGRNQCFGLGYASQREAENHQSRVISVWLADRGLRGSLVRSGNWLDDERIIYFGFKNNVFHGDSGGPIFCKNYENRYVLVGTLTAISPLTVEWRIPEGNTQKIELPDGSPLIGNTIHIFMGTSVKSWM